MDVIGKKAAVVSGNPLAAKAGIDILRMGGNAVDAAVGTVLAECVVEPQNVGLGGYGGAMVIHLAKEQRVVSIDFDSVAPMAATPDMFGIDADVSSEAGDSGLAPAAGRLNEFGCLSVSTPANVAGLALALKEYGSMSWAEVSKAAIDLAENGFPVYSDLVIPMARFSEQADEQSRRAFFVDKGAPAEGDLFIQQDLAKLLRKLADEGPEAFYGPEIAGQIVKQIQEGGGILQEADFSNYRATQAKAISVLCGSYELYTAGLPAGGLTSLQIVRAMHEMEIDYSECLDENYFHYLIEAAKLIWEDRMLYMGDPKFISDPTARFLSSNYIASLAEQVKRADEVDTRTTAMSSEGHTIHAVTADREHNMVSVTATHGAHFGSRIAIEGLGLVLGHGMSRFDPVPGKANSIAPAKRMLHNMCPMILLEAGNPKCAFGLPGGRKIVNVAAQMAFGFMELGMSPWEAINAPRIHTEGGEPVLVSSRLPEGILNALRERGHVLQVTEGDIGGPAAAVMLDSETGGLLAASQRGEDAVETL